MNFRQSWPLWVLLAALIPIIIHMLNRLRYKTVQWAAMIFLLKANKAATRRAKLRQYLLLLFRALAIFFMIFAMLRPVTGGWLGAAAGGAPEVIVVLLDRSASMEARAGDDRQETKRSHALSLLTEAAKNSAGSRFVVIENVLKQPTEMADLSTLGATQLGEQTDTAADIPTMLRTALEYLLRNKAGSWEIWVASDFQSSNWRPDSPEWQDIAARFEGLGETFVRVLDLSSSSKNNLSIAIKASEFRPSKGEKDKGTLALTLEAKSGGGTGTFPLKFTRDGATSQSDLVLESPVKREAMKIEIAKLPDGGGWGKAELPADDLAADNAAYFTYRAPVPLHASVVSDSPAARLFAVAAAPDASRADRTAEVVAPARVADIKWKTAALIVWQGAAPDEAVEKQLREFVESGGVLLAFPPGGDSASGPMGLTWTAAETGSEPFRIASWDELDGPLAKTDNGSSLRLANLEVTRRQLGRLGEAQHVFGVFSDGQPFLVGHRVGAGSVLACTTLPEKQWSTLGDGFVLLPMIQRLLVEGGARLAPPAIATAGEWKPEDGEFWTPLADAQPPEDRRRDPRWSAGIFKHADRLIALNRPESEDAADITNGEVLQKLLPRVKLNVMTGALDLKADRLESEIWPMMIVATMLFMCFEMLLATSKALIPRKPKPKVPVPSATPKREEAGV